MSVPLTSQANPLPADRIRERGTLPWLAACALLLVEYALTSYAIDIRPLAERWGWPAALGAAENLGSIFLAVVTATILLGGWSLWGNLDRALEAAAARADGRRIGRLLLVAIHIGCFTAFFFLTLRLTEAKGSLPANWMALTTAWVTCGLAALLALSYALLPLGALLQVVRDGGRALALGVALGITAWAGGIATLGIWDPLSTVTIHAVAATLRLAGPDIWVDPATATVAFEGFEVRIYPACSGYEGIGLITVLTGAYLWAFRSMLRFPHVLALVPIGIVLSWLTNVVRIAALMLVGARWSSDVALGSFHSKAGWVLFCGTALGLAALTQHSPLFSRDPRTREAGSTWNPTAAYLTPLLAVVGVHMATGLFTTGLPVLYPLGVVAGGAMLWWHRRDYPWLFRPTWSWQACAIGVGAFALWLALEPPAEPGALSDWQRELETLPPLGAGLWLVLRVLGSVAIVPLVEELAFRGYLLRRLLSADFTSVPFARFGWVPFLVSSLAFGLLHERWLAGTLAGMAFAFAQHRNGRLTDAVLAHAVTNLLVAIHAMGWQRWTLWI